MVEAMNDPVWVSATNNAIERVEARHAKQDAPVGVPHSAQLSVKRRDPATHRDLCQNRRDSLYSRIARHQVGAVHVTATGIWF
jgi:hypothetical protein